MSGEVKSRRVFITILTGLLSYAVVAPSQESAANVAVRGGFTALEPLQRNTR